MFRLLLYVALLIASLGAVLAGVPRGQRASQQWMAGALFVGLIALGVLVGFGYGWLFGPADGGPFVGAFAFGEAGFMAAICATVYRATNHPRWGPNESMPSPMPLPIAVSIPLGAVIGAAGGWLLPIDDSTEHAMMPIATALLGALLGVAFGAVYQNSVRGALVLAAVVAIAAAMFLVVAWLGLW